jgi:uncharacterized protein with HEPN domain
MEKDDFVSSNLVQDGTIRQIEIIGEATKNLSKNIREKYSQISWSDIAAHFPHFVINVEFIYLIVQNDHPDKG